MHLVTHPGPVHPERLQIAPCTGEPVELELAAGMPLEAAVGAAMAGAGLETAWLVFEDAPVDKLSYVMPDLCADGVHVAWYSAAHSFDRGGRIEELGMIAGRHKGQSFLHGHGRWTPEDGEIAMGHILAPLTVLSKPVRVRGIGIRGAAFERGPDPETAFELFHAVGREGAETPGYALLRMRPNQDFTIGLERACAALGWQAALAFGVGSLNCAVFEDGQVLDSLATELLVTGAEVSASGGKGIGISIVGIEGTGIFQGALKRGENAILITAEIVLKRVA